MELQTKTILITGASSGLGRALAHQISKTGASVLLLARREKELQSLVAELKAKGTKASYYCCDVRDEKQIQATVQAISNSSMMPDILINNAGIWTDDELEEFAPIRRKDALLTNVLGNINMTQAFLPYFKKINAGHIVNVISTSGASNTPSGNNALWKTYGASKWAMTGFTNALRDSLAGTHIKVSAFHPGGFESDLYESAGRPNPHNQPWMMKTDDVAELVVFMITRPDDMCIETMVASKVQQ